MKRVAVIVAGGRGERFGGAVPKQFALLGGVPILLRSLLAFELSECIDDIILVIREEDRQRVQEVIGTVASGGTHLTKIRAIVPGGAERQDSAFSGVQAAEVAPGDLIGIHDVVRPLITTKLICDLYKAAERLQAVAPAIPVAETVKRVGDSGRILETVPRKMLYLTQTPQVFEADLLRRAFIKAREDGFFANDDAALVEHLGHAVWIIQGDPYNLKITTPEDLILAECLWGQWRR
ncbi:MAG: 2-C-methyl-D-erythritol 4-phosphate cytidylyltransferase [Bacteroidota bacterium]